MNSWHDECEKNKDFYTDKNVEKMKNDFRGKEGQTGGVRDVFRAVGPFCVMGSWWTCVTVHLSELRDCTAPSAR